MKEARDGGLFEDKIMLLRSNVNALNSTLSQLNTWWGQRAKVNLLSDRDNNTKLFAFL